MSRELIILASASPRRRELLAGLGVAFEVITADVPELDASSGLAPVELARENARRKAAAVAALHPARWVLGADTIVTLDGRVFGKPASLDQAREFLLALSGRTHQVVTACALFQPDGAPAIFHDATRVTFQPLTEETIARYLAKVHVLDKAGAYALQEQGDRLIARIEGSSANVIGLPVERLGELLQSCGLI